MQKSHLQIMPNGKGPEIRYLRYAYDFLWIKKILTKCQIFWSMELQTHNIRLNTFSITHLSINY